MHPKYQEIIKLRLKGQSYGEIAKIAGVSKNSVSRWCKNLKLSQAAQEILEKKNKYPKEKFAAYNQQKHRLVLKENKEIINNAISQINSLSKRESSKISAN